MAKSRIPQEHVAYFEACVNWCFVAMKHNKDSVQYKAAESIIKETSLVLIKQGIPTDRLLREFNTLARDVEAGVFKNAMPTPQQWGYK